MEEREEDENKKSNENKNEKKNEKENKIEKEDNNENNNENKNEKEDKNENENKNNNENMNNIANNNDNMNGNINKNEEINSNKNENENKEEKKEETEKINYIPEFIKSNRLNNSKKIKNSFSTKRIYQDAIKVKGVLIKRSDSKESHDQQLNYTYRNDHNLNMLYLSPNLQEEKSFDNVTINTKSEKRMVKTESRKNIRDESHKKFSTPYRRINIKQKKLPISPSANVIIKNFNYNNVYNINIDNDKEKSKNKEVYENNKIIKNKDLNRFTHKYITYNKPKTTTNMNIKCIVSKKDLKNIDNIDNDVNIIKRHLNKNQTFYSRFISEGKYLKNNKDNFIANSAINSINSKSKMEEEKSLINNKINKSNVKVLTIRDNYNNKYYINKNLNMNNNRSNSYHINTKGIDNLNRIQNLSSSNNLYLKNTKNLPKDLRPNIIRTENNNDIEFLNILSFNLNDLNSFEDKINNIISKFNNISNFNEANAYKECHEFFYFYNNSTIKGIFVSFFKDNNKLIIESSINLSLFSIIVIYHLSKNNLLIPNLIKIIKNIMLFLKINFSLYIKRIQLNYNINNTKTNYIYFQSYNKFLMENNIRNSENEIDITFKIYQNCKQMTNDIKLILEYYKQVNTNYYNDFIKIFNNISIQSENELLNYFFKKILKIKNFYDLSSIVNKNKNEDKNLNTLFKITRKLKKNKTNINYGIFSPKKKSIFDNLSIKRGIKRINKPINSVQKIQKISKTKKEKKEKQDKSGAKNKIKIPYIINPSNHKYSLVLDLNKTLVYYNPEKGNIKLRNGLSSFLSMIKTYYELISFSNEPQNITNAIIQEIESEKKYFDYNLTRDNCIIYENNLVKDISLIGRDITKIIIIDDDENCFNLNKENGIKISKFNGDKEDNILFELKKILIVLYKKNYDDIRIALKDFSKDLKNKVSLS